MSSPPPPAGSPPSSSSLVSNKRHISLPNSGSAPKKHKPHRKPSIIGQHPLRQTSFPPEEDPDRKERSPSVDSLIGGTAGGGNAGGGKEKEPQDAAGVGNEEEDEEDRGDDYGTTSLLVDGALGGFGEDDERKMRLAYVIDPESWRGA
ncbi:hypothetical protein BDZ91DRAFT_196993 [Kalaharituber pfeilii]|nr:hypothetical protein BDZ91DRAFT_196993 [Kalaharituber pfeilii]